MHTHVWLAVDEKASGRGSASAATIIRAACLLVGGIVGLPRAAPERACMYCPSTLRTLQSQMQEGRPPSQTR
jgi:hypothetical protein